MANPQPGDPKLVAQIVNRLKSQGLFDQFRRDCLADVDTKPAYQNLRQRVDSFVSNHLAGHTWSPHLNKNQLRNNIRQQVLNSGMLESGIDRIISQVVDPKINQMFRPQVEKAVHDFLNNVAIREESSVNIMQNEEKTDSSVTAQGLSTVGPSTSVANDALSILETISSLNQEACAARASTENPCLKSSDRISKKLPTLQIMDTIMEKEPSSEEVQEKSDVPEPLTEVAEMPVRQENLHEAPCPSKEEVNIVMETSSVNLPSGDSVLAIEEKNCKVTEKSEDQRTNVSDKVEEQKAKTDKSDEKKGKIIEKSEEKKKADEQKIKVIEKSDEQRTKVTDKSEEPIAKETDASEVQKDKIFDKNEEQKVKKNDKSDKKTDIEKADKKEEKRENKTEKKIDHSKKTDDGVKAKEEKQWKEADSVKRTIPDKINKCKATEVLKAEYMLDDSDMDALSDVTVSSVHTSDLSSFEEESEEEAAISDSTEEGEITSDDEDENLEAQNKTKLQTDEQTEVKPKTGRHSYVHKPYLYSRYYSDSDDELTVEQRRQSIARAKEERLVRRQINRERLEEKRKLKATDNEKSLKTKTTGKMGGGKGSASKELESKTTSMKEVLKEQMILEKKVAVTQRRKRVSRFTENSWKRRYDYSEEDSRDSYKSETFEKTSSSKELKHMHVKSESRKSSRRSSEPVHLAEENKDDSKLERELKRRTSSVLEGTAQDSDSREIKKRVDRLETNYEEQQKKKTGSNVEKLKKDSNYIDTYSSKSTPKKEVKLCREKGDRERSLSEDKPSSRHRHKADGVQKSGEDLDRHSSERVLKGEEKHSQKSKASSDDKSDRKSKHKSERKPLAYSKDGRTVSEHTVRTDDSSRRESSRKERHLSSEKSKSEHKSRRSTSDSKTHRDSQGSSRQSSSASQKKTETCSEDKYDLDSTNSDSNSKHEDSSYKDRRRSKSSSEEKSSLKSKSKTPSKPSKSSEAESQEATQKLEKEASLGGGDADKHRNDNIVKESIIDKLQRIAYSGISSEKESAQKTKFQIGEKVIERCKSDYKELSLSKTEKKVAAECNTRSSKHSVREIKRKEDGNKSEEKQVKQMEESPEKNQEISQAPDKKSNRKTTSENTKSSLLLDTTNREAEVVVVTSVDGNTSPFKKQSGDNSPCTEQESDLMETDSHQNSQLIIKKRYCDSQQEDGSKDTATVPNVTGGKIRDTSKFKASNVILDLAPQIASTDYSKQHFEKENSAAGVDSETIDAIKPSEEQEAIQQGSHQMNISSLTSDTISIASSLAEQNCARSQKTETTSMCSKDISSVISSSTGEDVDNNSKDVNFSTHTGPMVCESIEQNEEITTLKEPSVMSASNLSDAADLELHKKSVSILDMEGSKGTMMGTGQETCDKEPFKAMHEAEASDALLIGLSTNTLRETDKLPSADKYCNFEKPVLPERSPMMGTVGDENAMKHIDSWENKPIDANQDTMTKLILTEITDTNGLVTGTDKDKGAGDTISLRTAGGCHVSDVGTSAELETCVAVNCSKVLSIIVNEEEAKTTPLCNSADEGEKGIDSRSKEAIGITVGNSKENEHLRSENVEGRDHVIGTSTENKVESTVMDMNTESVTGALRFSGKDEEATSSCSVMDSSTGRNKSAAPMICIERDSENAATSSGTVMDNSMTGKVFDTRMVTENYIENAATSSTTVGDRCTHKIETCAPSEKDSEAAASSSSTVMCTSNSTKQKEESELSVINSECDGDDSASSSGSVVGTSTWEGKVVKLSLVNDGDDTASSSGTVMGRNPDERAASSSGTMMDGGTEDRAASSSEAMMDINTEERAASSSGSIIETNAEDRAASSSETMMDRNTEERAASSSVSLMDSNTEERAASSSGTMMARNSEERAASSSGTMTDRNTEESTASSSGTMMDRNIEERTASSSGTTMDRNTEEGTASSSGTMTDNNTEERAASSSGTMMDERTEERAASSSEPMMDGSTEERAASSSVTMMDRLIEERTASSSETTIDGSTEKRPVSSSGTTMNRHTQDRDASSSGTMMDESTCERAATSSLAVRDRSAEELVEGTSVCSQKDSDDATSSSCTSGDNAGSESHIVKEMHGVIVDAEGNESSISNTQDDLDNSSVAASEAGGSVSSATCATESDITLPIAMPASSPNDEQVNSAINNGRQPGVDTVNVETIVNSEKIGEKEDTVSSASAEEKHKSFPLGNRQQFESTVSDLSETEGDRTVTSAGTIVAVASMTCEHSGESENSVSCANLEKDADGVTCADVDYPVGEVAISLDVKEEYPGIVNGANVQERVIEGLFTAACIGNDGDDAMTSTVMDHENQIGVNSGAEEGESTVTSTGITEDQSEGVAVCTETGTGGELLICCGVEEKEDDDTSNRMDQKEGDFSEDDESAITSTGTKDEEGEGIVTSTGTANDDSSSCIGTEENVEKVVVPTAPEEKDSVFCTNLNLKKGGAVTLTSAGKEQPVRTLTRVTAEIEDPTHCIRANETIEGAVTSANTKGDIVSPLSATASENKHEMLSKGTANVHESLMNTTTMKDGESQMTVLAKRGNGDSLSISPVTEIVKCLTKPLEPKRCEDSVCSPNSIEAKDDCDKNIEQMHMVVGTAVEVGERAVEVGESESEDSQGCRHKKEVECMANGQNTKALVSLTVSMTVEEKRLENVAEKDKSGDVSPNNTFLPSEDTAIQISEVGIPSTDNTGLATNLTSELKQEKDCDSSVSRNQNVSTNEVINDSQQVLTIENCEPKHEMSQSDESVKTVDIHNMSETDIKVSDAKEIHLTVEVEKRKRGRPKKHPLPIQENKQLANDTGQHEEKSSTDDDASDTFKECVPRRGRKPKRSCSATEDIETLAPERKRQRSESAAKENEEADNDDDNEDEHDDGCDEGDDDDDDDDEGEEEESDDDEDEKNRGATTRAASRLEAQRKQPPKPTTRAASKLGIPAPVSRRERQATKEKLASDAKSGKSTQLRSKPQPSTSVKRKREESPQAVRTRGQLTSDETQIKRVRKQ